MFRSMSHVGYTHECSEDVVDFCWSVAFVLYVNCYDLGTDGGFGVSGGLC